MVAHLLLLSTLGVSIATASVVFHRFYIVPGSRVENGNVLPEVQTSTNSAHCGLLCHGSMDCIAYNYCPDSLACELLSLNQAMNLLEPLPTPGCSCYFISLQNTRPTANAIATQKSTYAGGGDASLAIDGNTNGNWEAMSCTHTDSTDTGDWWMVQLQRVYPVTAVILWNRSAPLHVRLRDLTVYVASTQEQLGHADSVCGSYLGPPSNADPILIDCQRTMHGRYLKIVRTYPIEALTLCEVEIVQ